MSDFAQVEAVFLFADLSGFTALTETHGDMRGAYIAHQYAEITRKCLYPGTELVKTIGDEVMLVSTNPISAIQTALRLREAITQEPLFPIVRIGLHMGCAVVQNGDYFGTAVNLAARIVGHAYMGQVLSTKEVAMVACELKGVMCRMVDLVDFKNLSTPVPVYEIMADDHSLTDPIDPICRMRVKVEVAPVHLLFLGETYYFCSDECAGVFKQRNPLQLNVRDDKEE
jgi:class 3 adenylate cyclase/YHS domain-containing protein